MAETQEDKEWKEKYNEKDYAKSIYSFTAGELRKLSPFEAMIQSGQVAQALLTGILRNECLKRVGAKNTQDTGVQYDIASGQFFVYQPRFLCSLCNNKKAEFSSNGKYYCAGCVEILKAQQQKQEPKEEQKPKETKKKHG